MGEAAECRKFAVEKYLEQVKIVTTLATTLLVTPNALVALYPAEEAKGQVPVVLCQGLKPWLLTANISFALTIVLAYFIYSSVVGFIFQGEYDIHRPMTRVFSLLQLFTLAVGCTSLVVVLDFLYR